MKIYNVVCVFFSIPFFFGEQLSYFTKKGYKIYLTCSPSDKLKPFAQKHDCEYKEICIKREISPLSDLKALWQLYRYIRKERFDIVCGHTPKGGLLSILAAFCAGVHKRIFFRHGLLYETSTGLKHFMFINAERIASLFATKVVCVSPYLIEKSIKDRLTSERKLVLLKNGSCNGVDAMGKFNPEHIDINKLHNMRTSLGINEKAFVIGYTGRLVKDKGIIELVNAYITIYNTNSSFRLLLVGPLEERDALPYNIISTINTHPGIIYTGQVESDIEYYYALMDIMVLSTHREGFGTSILEASSMCKPVLTTAHTGSRDAIINAQTGFYIDTNSDSIIKHILMYVNNPILLKEHGYNGRKYVLENFRQELIWEEIENKLYKE